MERSPFVWNPKIHYCVEFILPLDLTVSYLNPEFYLLRYNTV
jgi:hypothetical protein